MDGGSWWATVHGVAKSQTQLSDFTFFLSMVPFGEGNGNPLQCSCLKNPVDRGAWWATVHRTAESDTTEETAYTQSPEPPLHLPPLLSMWSVSRFREEATLQAPELGQSPCLQHLWLPPSRGSILGLHKLPAHSGCLAETC